MHRGPRPAIGSLGLSTRKKPQRPRETTTHEALGDGDARPPDRLQGFFLDAGVWVPHRVAAPRPGDAAPLAREHGEVAAGCVRGRRCQLRRQEVLVACADRLGSIFGENVLVLRVRARQRKKNWCEQKTTVDGCCSSSISAWW